MEKILFNGRPASQMILNGDVIWTAIDLSHHVYYSIDNSSTTDTLTTQVDGKYIYLPNMDTEFSAIQVSIIGQTNTEVVDLEGAANILVSDVDQLRVYFPKNTTYVKFNGGSHRIKKLLHCDTGNLTDMESMFNGCTYLEYVTLLGWDTSNVRYISRLFNGCKNLKSITDLENLNFSGLTADEWGDEMGIWAMFNNCTSLTSLDLSSWDTSNVKYMTSTFNGCSALTTLNISSWDTSNLTSLDNIFSDCTNLLSLDLSNWDTSKVTAMRYAFSNCTSLTSLDLSNWDTSNVEYMNGMFSNISTDIDWNYDGSNYTNFNLTEFQTGYSGSFPWRSPYYVKYSVYGGAKSDNLLATDSSGNYKYLPLLGYISLDIPTDIEILLSDNSVLNDPSLAYLDEVKTIRVNYTEDTKRISFANTRITSIDYIKTDNLVSMFSMFDSCMYLYSLDISGWNTSNVTVISGMFNNCTYLEEVNVSNIDTSNVQGMSGVFSYCSSLLSLDLSSWDTSSVTDMTNMFSSCSTLASLNLNNWDTSNVTDMFNMFYACQKLTSLDLSHWNTDKVTRMNAMFFYCNKLTSLNISNFNTVNVSEYSYMFSNIPSTVDWHYSGSNYLNFTLTESQTGFNGTFPWTSGGNESPYYVEYTVDTSKDYALNGGSYMYGLPKIYSSTNTDGYYPTSDMVVITLNTGIKTRDLSTPCSSISKVKVTYPEDTFRIQFYGSSLYEPLVTTIEYIKTDNFTTMENMFYNCTKLTSVDFSKCNTSNVTDMSMMFYYCTALTSLDLSSFNTSNVTDMGHMFSGSTSIIFLDMSSFNTSNVTNSSNMLSSISDEVNFNYSDNYSNWTLSEEQTGFIGTFPWTSSSNDSPYYVEYTIVNEGSSYNLDSTYTNNGGTTYMYGLPKIYSSTNTDGYYPTSDMVEITLSDSTTISDLSTPCNNISKVKVFYPEDTFAVKFIGDSNCIQQVTSIDYIKTDNFTDMSYMFQYCQKLTSLDLSSFNTSNVINMYSMFIHCSSLTSLVVSSFNTSNVTNMDRMFVNCSSLTSLDLSSFDTSKVTSMNWMFAQCIKLESLNLSGWDTREVTGMEFMFGYCYALSSLDLSSFNTSKVTAMQQMFSSCTSLTSLNLSNFDTNAVTSYEGMFYGIPPVENWYYDGENYANFTLTAKQTGYGGGDFPWTKVNPYYIEYTVDTSKDYALNGGTSSATSSSAVRYGLPRIYSTSTSWSYPTSDMVEITKTNGVITNDLTTKCNLISKVKVTYPENTVAIRFYGSSSCSPQVKAINYIKTDNLTLMSSMFYYCKKLTTVNMSDCDISKVTNMYQMFYECSSLTSVNFSNCITTSLSSMGYMFYGCTSLRTLNLSSFNTSNVTTMAYMLYNCKALTSINLSSFDTSKVSTRNQMFSSVPSTVNFNYSGSNYSSWTLTESQTNFSGKFPWNFYVEYTLIDNPTGSTLESAALPSIYSSYASSTLPTVSQIKLFDADGNRVGFPDADENYLYLFKGYTIRVYYPSDTFKISFEGIENIKSVNYMVTDNFISMDCMFYNCTSLTSVDASKWITNNVIDMLRMFVNCSSLTSLNLSTCNTSNVTSMYEMFYGCSSLTSLNLSTWNTSNVTSMTNMFYNVNAPLDWSFNGSNYTNFTLSESQTGYSGTFPWNIEPLIIDYKASTTLPTYPSWFTRTDSGSTGHFNFVTTSELLSGGQLYCGYGTNTSYCQSELRFNVTPDADMMMRITGYVSGNGDYLYVNCKKDTDTSYTTYYSSSYGYPFTTTINLESGNTYNLEFLYSKDESDEEPSPGASITKIEFFYLEPPVETPDSYLIDWETTNPTLPSWITPHQVSTSYSFSRGSLTYESVTYTGLVPNNRGVKSTIAWNCYKVVAPLTGTLEVSLTNYAESNYDFTSVYLTQLTSQPNATSQGSGCLFFGKGKQSSTKQTGTISVTAGTTYYLHFLYRKDTSTDTALDAGVIHSIKLY